VVAVAVPDGLLAEDGEAFWITPAGVGFGGFSSCGEITDPISPQPQQAMTMTSNPEAAAISFPLPVARNWRQAGEGLA
jgi:hypothetical protein